MSGDGCTDRPLFGGAITAAFPSRFQDVSGIRQVPDHQEAYVDPSRDESFVFELLEFKHDVFDEGVLRGFFKILLGRPRLRELCCNIDEGGIALAEAVHGSAPDIAGKNLANPTALLLSAVTMLHHLELHAKADRIQDAVLKTIAEGKYRTGDLGGRPTTAEFTKAICDHL